MTLKKVPPASSVSDAQFVQVQGPDDLLTGFQYDSQTKSFWAKDSQVLTPGFHGSTHIAEDPVPVATCDSDGLMSDDDKCKLDAMLATRLGVLGFQGAGFPDDGGFLQGDIILAAGSEFISIERVGNIVRFTVDSPIPLNCNCETCAQIFWVQDETDVASIRPPSCAGKLPGVNAYGEMKIYLMPESLIVDPANPAGTLNTKGQYPTLIFKRYENTLSTGLGQLELVLQRDVVTNSVTTVGWSMTPGPAGVPECVWFMGTDNGGNRVRFDLNPNSEPGLLGNLLYKGHNLTKSMAVITDYTSDVLSTNQYVIKNWDVVNEEAIGDGITATNIWQFDNPEGPDSGSNAKALVLDRTVNILPVGTLVDLWFFQISEVSGEPIRRYFFSQRPSVNDCDLWTEIGGVEFGDILVARREGNYTLGDTGSTTATDNVSDVRNVERTIWGITGFDDPLVFTGDLTGGPVDLNSQHRAVIDTSLPGLTVEDSGAADPFSERPVFVWNRNRVDNVLAIADLGKPDDNGFPPYDILLHAPIDSYENVYMKVVEEGIIGADYFVRVKGVTWNELPQFGAIRILRPTADDTGAQENTVWNYEGKAIFPDDNDSVILLGTESFDGGDCDIVELLHQDYTAPCVRIEFSENAGTISTQFKVGTLDMSAAYEGDDAGDDDDDMVRGMADYAVSQIYSQSSTYDGIGDPPGSNVDGWLVYDGGLNVNSEEFWNRLEVMQRGNQIWIWWNGLLVPPDTNLSGALPDPNPVDTPYFPINLPSEYGKFGMRLWPGVKVRRALIRTCTIGFNEFTRGQLTLS